MSVFLMIEIRWLSIICHKSVRTTKIVSVDGAEAGILLKISAFAPSEKNLGGAGGQSMVIGKKEE